MIRTALFLAAMTLAAAGQAQGPDRARIERLRSLPPEKLAELKKRLEQFKKLPGEEQQRLRDNLQKIRGMAPEQVKKLRERAEKLSDEERKEYSDLASGFFRWAQRNRRLEGFPRAVFFHWLKKERPEKMAEIRSMEPGPGGPRVEAWIRLSEEFRGVVLDRAREHVQQHRCAPAEDVNGLSDLSAQEFWPRFQELQRGCPLNVPKATPAAPVPRPLEKHRR
jgi:hypothetical protein